MFNFAKLAHSLFPDSIFDDIQGPRTSCINLVQMNTSVIDHHNNWKILFFKEEIKIKEKKRLLNTGI